MREFWRDFSDTSNFPVNLWLLLVTLAAPVTGYALYEPFGRVVYGRDCPAFLAGATLAALLWLVSVVPLYFAPLPMESPWRKLWVALVMAGSVYVPLRFLPDAAIWMDRAGWPGELGPVLLFWGPCLGLGLPAFFEKRDAFDMEAPRGLLFIIRRR